MPYVSCLLFLSHVSLGALMAALVLALLSGILLMVPRRTWIADGQLQISSPVHTWRYPLASIRSAMPFVSEPLHTLRLCAVGWPLPPVGWLWNHRFGRFLALAQSRKHLQLLEFTDGTHLLVSLPPEEEGLQPVGVRNRSPQPRNSHRAPLSGSSSTDPA